MLYTSLSSADHIAPNGQEIKQHGTRQFPCGFYTGTREIQVPWHWHDEYECSVILQGSVCYNTPQGRFLLQAGDGIFLNSGTLHTTEPLRQSAFLKNDLVFHGRLVYGSTDSILYQKYILPLTDPEAPQIMLLHRTVPWQADILERIRKAFRLCQNRPEGYEFSVRTLLSDILFDIYCYRSVPARESAPGNCFENDRIKQMLLYLQENYNRTVTVAEVAAHANICQRECLRCFRKILRLSPIQYLIRYRISRACILLRNSHRSILEIGNSCGFESPSYFTKTFRQHVGCTPSQYRSRFRTDTAAKTKEPSAPDSQHKS